MNADDPTPTQQETLLPCPFCGADAKLSYEGLGVDAAFDCSPYGRINCSEGAFRCCPELQFESSEEAEAAAIKEWNTRAVLVVPTSFVKDGGGLAPERLTKRVCKDGFIDCGYHSKSESREVEYVRTDLAHANSTEDVGHPRINGWPCVCSECVSKRARATVAGPRGDAWKPIESAPRNGAAILVGHERHGSRLVRWMISVAKDAPNGWWFVDGYDGPRLVWEPTHWMFVPALDAATSSPTPTESGVQQALEGIVAAFDNDEGDVEIRRVTRECAMSIAKQALGWDTAPPESTRVEGEQEDPHPGYDCGSTCAVHNQTTLWLKHCRQTGFIKPDATPHQVSDSTRLAAEEIAAWVFKLEHPLTSELDLSVTQDKVAAIISKYFAAVPVEQAPEALKRASKLCRSVIPGARVELIFQNLQDAQTVHEWLVTLAAAAPADNDAESERAAVVAYLKQFDGPSLLPMLIADIEAGCHRTTTKGDR